MGIDYSGGMIVGARATEIPREYDEEEMDFFQWCEENDLDAMSEYYDADEDHHIVGFEVSDVLVHEIDGEWLKDVKTKAQAFFELTGVHAKLIGTQNIW